MGKVTNSGAIGTARLRLVHAGIIAVAALLLAACTASPPAVEPQASLPAPAKPAETTDMSPATLREHQRILAAYGGVYNDPKLQGMIEQTVERLVAASERPDLHYKTRWRMTSPIASTSIRRRYRSRRSSQLWTRSIF